MTNTYLTGNHLGSTAAKDLSDNSSNFDEFINSESPAIKDRFLKRRQTVAGFEAMAADVIASLGFEATHLVYVDGSPLTVSRPTQLIDYEGLSYKVQQPAVFPVTLSGTWATDEPKLKLINSDQILRSDLAQLDGSELVGTPDKNGSLSNVAVELGVLRDEIEVTVDTSAEVVAAVAAGGKVVIKNGSRYMTAPAVCDYGVEPVVGFPGNPSKRYDISGETPGGTILNIQHGDFGISLLNSIPGQSVGGFDKLSNLTILGSGGATLPNTDNSGGSGVKITNKAATTIENLNILNCAQGLRLENVLSSKVSRLDVSGCYTGIYAFANLSGAMPSAPNATQWSSIRVANSYATAIQIEAGASISFDQLTIEGCGTMGTNSAGLVIRSLPGDIASTYNIDGFYAELNAGVADIYIDNTSAHPVVVNISGSFFARVSSSTYVTHNIQATSSGGGKVFVNLIGCSFLSALGYPVDPARGFWNMGPNCQITYDDACMFSELTSLPAPAKRFTTVTSIQVGRDGSMGNAMPGFSCVKESVGTYLVTSNSDLAATEYGYNVTPTISGFASNPASAAVGATCLTLSKNQFRVFTYAAAGTLVDSHFTALITRFH